VPNRNILTYLLTYLVQAGQVRAVSYFADPYNTAG